jgi:hypothetical protein
MAERRIPCFGGLRVENRSGQSYGNPTSFSAHVTTRATALTAERLTGAMAVGSLCLASQGKLYVKVANNNAAADWEKVTTTAAD